EALSARQQERLEAVEKTLADLAHRTERRLESLQKTLEENLQKLRESNEGKLEQMRATVDEKLQDTLEKRLGHSFALVSERLEQVHKGIGEMQSLASGVGDLKRVLTNVRARGSWGEVHLSMLLNDLLTVEQFATNVRIRPDSAEAVEFAIKLPGREDGAPVYLPIDAKFPQADYERLLRAQETGATDEADQAAEALAKAKQPLTMKERLRAVEEMLDGGAATDALTEIDKLAAVPGAPKRELQHLKASALLRSRSYLEAAKAFQAAAMSRSGREAEQLTLSARALARAGKDAEAIKRYAEVFARYKATPYGEQSAYQMARLMLQNGRFKEAEAAFTKYLATFPKGKDRSDAEVERALALLSAGSAAQARKQFALLAQKAKVDAAGKLRELEGLAALRAGDKADAVKLWVDVVTTYPLSWASLSARSRLLSLGAEVPPLLPASSAKAAKAAQAGADEPPAPLPVSLPPTPAFLYSLGLDGDAEVRLASNEPEAAAAYAGRESEALCAMYGMLSRAKRRYRVGAAAVSYSALMRAPSPSERWAWDCIYPRPYAEPVRALEEQYGLPKGILYALMRQESAFDPAAKSPADAVGLMQLIPPTATRVAAELSMPYDPAALTSPEVSLKLGAHYFAKLLKMFQGSVTLASAAYNAGPKAVSHWLATGADNDADLWVARIPYDETRNYVARVAGNLSRYQWLEGGDAAVTVLPLELPVDARAPADAY
ncbi:MAG: DNA recombination protein RmuC, partial [Polyangiaceae bacterium]|nr:DNA recombination protein RmuC [Polyangiaceae bacterium]